MKKKDRSTAIIWAGIGLYFAFEGYQLKLGTLHNPGSGLFIFGAGIILSGLSMALLIKTFLSKSEEEKALWEGIQWSAGLKVMVALVIYVLSFRWFGFFLSTFSLLLFLFKALEPQKLWIAFTLASLSVALCYLIFGVFLELQFPGGISERLLTWIASIK